MSVHIRIVTPVAHSGTDQAPFFEGLLGAEDTLDFRELDEGPGSVESAYDAALAAPGTIARVIEAEREGADAVIIDCMGDPGLVAARQCVDIPVLGPCEMAMGLACTLGNSFSILSISRSVHSAFRRRANEYGFAGKYASTRSVEIPVAELGGRVGVLRGRLVDAARLAVEEDGADTLVIGCTRMFGAARDLRADLASLGLDVPVIDPVPASVKLAKALVELGLAHSKHAFPTPRQMRPVLNGTPRVAVTAGH